MVGEQKAKMGDFVPLGSLRLRRDESQNLHLPLVALKGHERGTHPVGGSRAEKKLKGSTGL